MTKSSISPFQEDQKIKIVTPNPRVLTPAKPILEFSRFQLHRQLIESAFKEPIFQYKSYESRMSDFWIRGFACANEETIYVESKEGVCDNWNDRRARHKWVIKHQVVGKT